MALVKISDTQYVNPDMISYMEVEKDSLTLWIDGRSYRIKSNINEIVKKFKDTNNNLYGHQHFAG